MRKRKDRWAASRKADAVLLEQEITREDGFERSDQTQDMFETRKIPIVILSEFFNQKKEFQMENKPEDKIQAYNSGADKAKETPRGEYGDKSWQNPRFGVKDNPSEVPQVIKPKDTLEVDAGERMKAESDPAFTKDQPVDLKGEQVKEDKTKSV